MNLINTLLLSLFCSFLLFIEAQERTCYCGDANVFGSVSPVANDKNWEGYFRDNFAWGNIISCWSGAKELSPAISSCNVQWTLNNQTTRLDFYQILEDTYVTILERCDYYGGDRLPCQCPKPKEDIKLKFKYNK